MMERGEGGVQSEKGRWRKTEIGTKMAHLLGERYRRRLAGNGFSKLFSRVAKRKKSR